MSWSNTPPDVPGLYWVVFKDNDEVHPAEFTGNHRYGWSIMASDMIYHSDELRLFHPMPPRPALPPT